MSDENTVLFEARTFFVRIKSLYETTGYSRYQLNPWRLSGSFFQLEQKAINFSSAREAIYAVQQGFSPTNNANNPIIGRAVDWHLSHLTSTGHDLFKLPSNFQESDFSDPAKNVERNGRRLSPDFLWRMNEVLEMNKFCLNDYTRRLRILELGAGLGQTARIISLFHKASYVIIDIPETLVFSYIFLKLNFPQARFLFVLEANQLKDTEEFDFVFVPTLFAERLLGSHFDLFINTKSLGEMNNSVIEHWMDYIQNKLEIEHLFLSNRYLNRINPILGSNSLPTIWRVNYRLDENQGSVLLSPNWKILEWELIPRYTQCPYVDTLHPNYLTIIAERNYPRDAKDQSSLLQSEVVDEDWIRLNKMSWFGILVNNFSMSGTLFKLWNSIRLNPNESNVLTMIKWLENLEHRLHVKFEETFYYRDLFVILQKNKIDNILGLSRIITTKYQNQARVRKRVLRYLYEGLPHR